MTLSVQFATMAIMVLSGIYLGIAQDTFRRFSVHWKGKRVTSYFLEISFWLLQTLIIFYCLFLVNAGEIRLYIFLACLLGFSFYQALLNTLYKRLLERVIDIFRAIFQFFKRLFILLIIMPLKWIFLVCSSVIIFLFQIVIKLLGFIFKVILFPFLLIGRMLQPFIPEKFKKLLHKSSSIYSTIRIKLKKGIEYLTFRRR